MLLQRRAAGSHHWICQSICHVALLACVKRRSELFHCVIPACHARWFGPIRRCQPCRSVLLQPIELLLSVCRRMTDLNRRTYENVTGILKSMSGAAKFVRVDVTPERDCQN